MVSSNPLSFPPRSSEEAFDKMQHLFMVQVPANSGRKKCAQPDARHLQKPLQPASHLTNDDQVSTSLWSGAGQASVPECQACPGHAQEKQVKSNTVTEVKASSPPLQEP